MEGTGAFPQSTRRSNVTMQPDKDSVDSQIALPSHEAAQRYLLHDPREIRRVLQALVDARSLISAYLSPGGMSCPTAILELGADELLIDGLHQETINQRIASANHLVCTSQLEQVRIQFRLSGLVRVQQDGYTAFRAPFPDKVLELQRRSLYRIMVPAGEPLLCSVPLPQADGSRATTELRVLDISGGGLALMIPEPHADAFGVHAEFDDCQLNLPDAASVQVRLAVCHVHTRQIRNSSQRQAGCRFVGLPRKDEAQILQYIFRIDRQRTARERRAV